MRFHSHRVRRPGLFLAVAVALAASAAVVATVALGASSSTKVTLKVSHVAKIGRTGKTITIRGSVSCTKKRSFVLSAIGVEPKSRAAAHGSVPALGVTKVPTCVPPRKSFALVANQTGEKSPVALKPGPFRACFFVRSWWQKGPIRLDARCFTLRASRS